MKNAFFTTLAASRSLFGGNAAIVADIAPPIVIYIDGRSIKAAIFGSLIPNRTSRNALPNPIIVARSIY
jgi:hypothetical protein